jgi:putative DNA primase/helicase
MTDVASLDRAGALLDQHAERLGGALVVAQRARMRVNDAALGDPPVRKLDYVMADALSDTDEVFDDELIEGTLGRGAMAMIFGDSNSGKTFAAIDMAAAVAQGIEWLGRPTVGGPVVYLATEAPASVVMRLRAYHRHRGVRIQGLAVVRSSINLYDGDADTAAIISLVRGFEALHGEKVVLIIGDTLARLAAGANENAGDDMSIVLQHVDAIRAATGSAFALIHHTGKDAARGMRGWSGMRAAIDTEIEVTVDEPTGLRSAEITKQRDLPGKGDRIGFRLVPVLLGRNRWGNERASCVVESSEAPTKAARGKRPSEIAGALTEYLNECGGGRLRGVVAKHFEGRYARQSVYRELGKMLDAGLLIETAGIVALAGGPTRVGT